VLANFMVIIASLKQNTNARYVYIRYQIYQQQLKVMLTALAQMLAFFMMILYVALPAIFLSALISLSVIADIKTTVADRIIYQWAYLLLVFLIIRIQKSAIIASHYRYYHQSLLIPNKTRKTATLLLTLLAGNIPLLAPIALALFIPNIKILMAHLYFPLFAINVLLMALVTIKQANLPWFSLIILPITIFTLTTKTTIFNHTTLTNNAIILNALWLAFSLLEIWLLKHFSQLKTDFLTRVIAFSGKYYWQFRLIEIKQQLAANLSRLFALFLLIALVVIVQNKMQLVAIIPLQLFMLYLFSIVIASYQFDNEAFYRKYNYYLNTTLITKQARFYYDSLPMVLLVLFVTMVSILALNFTVYSLVILPLNTLISLLSVRHFPRNFFIPPSIFMMVIALSYVYNYSP
jgi:uncharacterized protein DUF6136